jgi:hypothetical protein
MCIDITRDVMGRLQMGESLSEIRTYIDQIYSRFGPPTDTRMP